MVSHARSKVWNFLTWAFPYLSGAIPMSAARIEKFAGTPNRRHAKMEPAHDADRR